MCTLCDAYDGADYLIILINKLLGTNFDFVGEEGVEFKYAEDKHKNESLY